MEPGSFGFLKDSYYVDFPDKNLMRSKEMQNNRPHACPCFFSFPDEAEPRILWLVPISSRCEKYQKIYQRKMKQYGYCDTIHFGKVLGTRAAFLIQNMCPATARYISEEYHTQNGEPVQVDRRTVKAVTQKARKVLHLQLIEHMSFIFPNVANIRAELIQQLEKKAPLVEDYIRWASKMADAFNKEQRPTPPEDRDREQ